MGGAARIGIAEFSLIYLLLLVVLFIMKRAKIDKMKMLLLASVRMTVQLVIAGFVLMYILKYPNPLYTVLFLAAMIAFSVHRIYSTRKGLNRKFKTAIAFSLMIPGLGVLAYFVCAVVREDFFNAQYTVPLAGMVIGNSMTGMTLGLRSFMESIHDQRKKIDALLYMGVEPKNILKPFVGSALETALLPTLNSMLGMGIIFLPGMMTGQILSGTPPTTAIMYQIAIMIAICTSVSLSVFCMLNFGYRTLYNSRSQMLPEE